MAKRTSTDEKLEKIIAFFKKAPEFYTIKDLDKRIPKECGISAMLVPDLLKQLTDNDMLSVEKCGSSNIYWLFPQQKHHSCYCETEKLELAIEGYREENEKRRRQVEKVKEMKQESEERIELMERWKRLAAETAAMEERKKAAAEAEECRAMRREVEELKRVANKSTEDVFMLQSYVCGRYGLSKKEFNKNFSIEEEFDYVG